jgi:methanogenic corrinoid protein MtbC1
LFSNYVGWAKVRFVGLEFSIEDLVASLEITGDILRSSLPPDMETIATEYIDVGLKKLQESPENLSSFIEPSQSLGALAKRYLEALLNTERHTATRLVLEAAEASTPIKDIYLHVFQPAQREIGRLWQTNQISVAHEHYCTAATQMIMSQLYPYIFNTEKNGRRLVAACVGDELHEIGIRMVTDFFEMEGWDTYYLGANVPTDSILRTVAECQADILAISATMTFHVSTVKSLIEQVRNSEAAEHVKIMVGGYPFNIVPDLWQQFKADGYAKDAQAAIDTANQLINRRVQP